MSGALKRAATEFARTVSSSYAQEASKQTAEVSSIAERIRKIDADVAELNKALLKLGRIDTYEFMAGTHDQLDKILKLLEKAEKSLSK